MPGDEREREVRLDELLLGVLEEARVANIVVILERRLCFGEVRGSNRDQLAGLPELAAVHGANRGRTRSDRAA